jgi:nitrite reductase/ring-hydroxylating ferredoxin subunit
MWWTTLAGKLEQASALDPAVRAASGAVTAVLPQGPLKDVLHGRWLGHAVHPLLVTVPIGMWTGAILLDLTGEEWARRAARRLVGAGLLAVAPTAATGLADWSELGDFHRPKRVGLVHAGANTATALLYAASWLARRRGDHRRGRDLALAGAAGVAVGGYLGGHLSYSEGVGVNRNADERREPADWTDAGAADLPDGGRRRVDLDGQQVLLVRQHGLLHAMGATCSHLGGPLERGALEEGCVVCPWHQSRFRLHDGSVARSPATSPQLAYDVRVAGGRVEVRARR